MSRSKRRTNGDHQEDLPARRIRVSTEAEFIEILERRNEELTREKEELTREKEELTREKDELNREKDELNRKIEELTTNNEELTEEKEELIKKNQELTRENVELNRKNVELAEKNEELTRACKVQVRCLEMMQSEASQGNNRIYVQQAQVENAQVIPEGPVRLIPSMIGADVLDMTGGVYANSFEENLSKLSDHGCILINEMLDELKKDAFRYLKTWKVRSRRQGASDVVTNMLNVMLSEEHIHLFKEERLIFTTAKDSVWIQIVFATLPELNLEERTRWVKYFANAAAKKKSAFGEFATAFVRIHNRVCRECPMRTA